MSIENYEILQQAIARNSAAILALPSAGMVRHHKTRFLEEAGDGFWIESTGEADRPLVDSVMIEKTAVGLVFKSGPQSVMFTTVIKSRAANLKISESTTVEALLLAFPQDFQRQQRRQAYRAPVPPGHVQLRMWRIPERVQIRDRPLASLELFATVDDFSVTGIGVHCQPSRDGKAAVVQANERLRILLTWGKSEILTEGRLMHRRDLANNVSEMGIQFKKLEKDFEGRQTLAKFSELVGYLQREEIKRLRLVAV